MKKVAKEEKKKESKVAEKSTAKTPIQKFQEEMNKKFGKNAIMLATEIVPYAQIKIPTSSISLDIALGGGIPVGRFTHVSGAESSFKSTIIYHIIANAQKMTKTVIVKHGDKEVSKKVPLRCLLVQSESGTFTADYGELLGVSVDDLMLNQCQGMEEALEIALQAQKLEVADVIFFDSFESLTPTKEYDSSMMDSVQMGIKPKLFGEYFRKYCAINNKLLREGKHPCTLVGINQLREKIGTYGDPLYSPGGGALKFHASIEVRFRKGDIIKVGTGVNQYVVGQTIKFKVNKNKVAVPMRTGSFDIYFDDGGAVPKGYVDIYKEIVLEGLMYGIIKKGGSWLTYNKEKVQGVDTFIDLVKKDNKLFEEIREELMKAVEESDELPPDMESDFDDEEEL